MKRVVLLLVAAVCIASLVPAAAFGKDQSVEVEYWQYYYESKVKLIDQLIADFQRETGIKVKHVTFPYEQFNEKVAASVPAGKGPDVITLYYGWLPKYLDSNYLQPLPDDLFSVEKVEKDFVPMVSAVKFRGKYWALPTAVRSLALFWNKDLFSEAGLPGPPETWDQLREYAIKLTKRGKKGELLQAGYAWNLNGQDHHVFREVLLRQWGVQPYSDDYTKVLWNSKQEGYDAFRWFMDLCKVDKVGEESFYTDYRTAFIAGKAAMMIDGSFALGTLQSKAPNLKWGVAELPVRGAGGVKSNFGSFWCHGITSKAQGETKKAAAKFIEFITSERAMRLWLEKVGELPARKALASDPDLIKDPKYGPFIAGLNYAHATFFVDEKADRQALLDAADRVLTQNADYKTALDEAVVKAQKVLDDYWAKH